MLARHQPQPGRQLPPVTKRPHIPHRRQQRRRRDGADPRNTHCNRWAKADPPWPSGCNGCFQLIRPRIHGDSVSLASASSADVFVTGGSLQVGAPSRASPYRWTRAVIGHQQTGAPVTSAGLRYTASGGSCGVGPEDGPMRGCGSRRGGTGTWQRSARQPHGPHRLCPVVDWTYQA